MVDIASIRDAIQGIAEMVAQEHQVAKFGSEYRARLHAAHANLERAIRQLNRLIPSNES